MQNKLFVAGIIVAAHGIKGHAIIKSFTNKPSNICHLPLIDELNNLYNLKLIREYEQSKIICSLNNIDSRDQIESLLKTKLYCDVKDLPQLEDEEFYALNLKNLKVLTPDLKEIGIIKDIYNFGAGDIIEIKYLDNKIELFPFSNQFFPTITKNYVILTQV